MAQLIDSPARNTRSHTRTEPPLPALLPAHTSPRAQRHRAVKEPADLLDNDAWTYPDGTLLGEFPCAPIFYIVSSSTLTIRPWWWSSVSPEAMEIESLRPLQHLAGATAT